MKTKIIDGVDFIEYQECDLRFTGWEHECIIIDRTENHYFIPKNRYDELVKAEEPKKITITRERLPHEGATGFAGVSGTVGVKSL